MSSRVRSGLEAWAAASAADQQDSSSRKKKTKKGVGKFGLRFVESPSAGLRYKILTCVRVCVCGRVRVQSHIQTSFLLLL